jgi:hypothetical protein
MMDERTHKMTIAEIPAWVEKLIEDPARMPARDVEEYLRAFLRLLLPLSDLRLIEVSHFLSLVEEALVSEPLDFEPAWVHSYESNRELERRSAGFPVVIAVLQRQIVDLREMRWAGILDGRFIDLGVSSPRGETFYNFNLHWFLGCAGAGMENSSHSSEWQDLSEMDWHQAMFFFWCGQNWE